MINLIATCTLTLNMSFVHVSDLILMHMDNRKLPFYYYEILSIV